MSGDLFTTLWCSDGIYSLWPECLLFPYNVATTAASPPQLNVIDDVMMSRDHIGSADQSQTTLCDDDLLLL